MRSLSTTTALVLLCSLVTSTLAIKPLKIGEHYPIHVSSTGESVIAPELSEPDQGRYIKKTYRIVHEDASYIALHFASMDLDPSCSLEVSDASGGQLYTLRGRGRHQLSKFWARLIAGDSAVFSLYCKGKDKKGDFVVDEYVAGYKNADLKGAQDRKRNLRGEKNELFPWEGRDLSVCGDNDMRNAQCYGETTEYNKAKAVARLVIDGSEACTGWLMGPNNHLVTNQHCIGTEEQALNTDYQFMYEVPGGGDCSTQVAETVTSWQSYDAQGLVVASATDDFAIIYMENNPAGTFGFLEIDNRVPDVSEKIYIPQHGSVDKSIAIYESSLGTNERCEVTINSGGSYLPGVDYSDVRYACDTQAGSSGSPVLSVTNNKVVALHYAGGGCAGNTGVPIAGVFADFQAAIDGTAPPTVAPPLCPEGTFEFRLDLTLDGYPADTFWKLENSSGNIVTSGGGYTVANQDIDTYECLEAGAHTFTITDGFGDGLCCSYGNGSYKVFYEGVEVLSGGASFSTDSVSFGSPAVSTPAPTSLPTLFPTPSPTLNPTPEPTPFPTPVPDPTPFPTPEPTPPPTTMAPTVPPTPEPTRDPTIAPTPSPTPPPTTPQPTISPTPEPTRNPTIAPTPFPTPTCSCSGFTRAKDCNSSTCGCEWDGGTKTCSSTSPVAPVAPEPTAAPVEAPSGAGCSCSDFTSRNGCNRSTCGGASCSWNKSSRICS